MQPNSSEKSSTCVWRKQAHTSDTYVLCSVNRYREPLGGDRVVYGLIGANMVSWLAWQSRPELMRTHAGAAQPCRCWVFS